MNLFIARIVLILFCSYGGWWIGMSSFATTPAAAVGAAVGSLCALGAVLLEVSLRSNHVKVIIAGAAGTIIGLIIANLFTYSFLAFRADKSPLSLLLCLLINAAFGYLGLALGAQKGEELDVSGWSMLGKKEPDGRSYKILDTSVIIDGRISDVCETGFIEGTLVIPQFVLRELTSIADSSDSLKRNRGRRGLDILKKIQKQTSIEVKIVEQDFPKIKEVDAKLVALAKQMNAGVITNDFNLNKVAEIQGVAVLSINQLATSVKPLVLPGEIMKVYIQREGKEPGQGVAYLDDGTMVVVENGKRYQGKDVDVAVTSVLQTTAGRMIFAVVKGENPGTAFPASQQQRI
jgi:uncharacterized protein YacL